MVKYYCYFSKLARTEKDSIAESLVEGSSECVTEIQRGFLELLVVKWTQLPNKRGSTLSPATARSFLH